MKTQDCTTCQHRGSHPAPTHQGQVWFCHRHMFWVGDTVTNCTQHKPAPSDQRTPAA